MQDESLLPHTEILCAGFFQFRMLLFAIAALCAHFHSLIGPIVAVLVGMCALSQIPKVGSRTNGRDNDRRRQELPLHRLCSAREQGMIIYNRLH